MSVFSGLPQKQGVGWLRQRRAGQSRPYGGGWTVVCGNDSGETPCLEWEVRNLPKSPQNCHILPKKRAPRGPKLLALRVCAQGAPPFSGYLGTWRCRNSENPGAFVVLPSAAGAAPLSEATSPSSGATPPMKVPHFLDRGSMPNYGPAKTGGPA